MRYDLLIRAERAITQEGERRISVAIRDGSIVDLLDFDAIVSAQSIVEVQGVLLPGLVDTHVHVNEPGRTEWEGFASATNAAAAGGVTTLIDMPLNSIPPTVTVEALAIKEVAAAGKCRIDVGFWGGSIPGNKGDLIALHEAGVFGFKCFLIDSGVEEFPASSPRDLEESLRTLAQVDAPMLIHAEDQSSICEIANGASVHYADFLASRPKLAESKAIGQAIEIARRTGARIHILHLANAEALNQIEDAKSDGVRITVETCPHYLFLRSEDIPDGATEYKCCPPIRDSENRDGLWAGLRRGAIDLVVSDHSPCTPELKGLAEGDFGAAWGGISSLQLGLSVIWTEAERRHVPLSEIVMWMATRPAALAGLAKKGAIAIGKDADLISFDPTAQFQVDPARLHHKNPLTPYAGKHLKGVVSHSWLRGRLIQQDGQMLGEPIGRLLTRRNS
jgi:allantoinase